MEINSDNVLDSDKESSNPSDTITNNDTGYSSTSSTNNAYNINKKISSLTDNLNLNQANLLSSSKPMSPPVELRTLRSNLNEMYRQSKKMKAKIMPDHESASTSSISEMNHSKRISSFEAQTESRSHKNEFEEDLNQIKSENSQFNVKLEESDNCKSQKSARKRLNRHLDRERDLQLIKQMDLQSSEDESNKSVQSIIQSSNQALKNSILKSRNSKESELGNQLTNQQSSDLNLNLKSTLHHALESKYAYLSFQDSFNIKDYQSFDSEKSSRISANRNIKRLSSLKDSLNLKSLDASFSTSLDLVDIVNGQDKKDETTELEDLISLKAKSLSASKLTNRSTSSKNFEDDLNKKEVIEIEEKDIVQNNSNDNYLYDKINRQKFQFKSFVDVIRLIKNWAIGDNKEENKLQESMKDFHTMFTTPIEEKEFRFLCFGNLVVDPNKQAYYYWLIVISFATLYNLLMIVGRSTFWELQNNHYLLWIFLDYLCDFIYLVDIGVNSRTAYLEQGLIVRDTKKLWLNYYHDVSFKLDILSSLPTDFYLLYKGVYCDTLQIPCNVIIRLNRLIKIYRLMECFDRIETRTNYPNAFRISKMIFIILVVIHWNGCLYFYMSYLIGFSIDKWTFNLTANPDFSDQYIYWLVFLNGLKCFKTKILAFEPNSFYWSTLTLTAIGEVPTPTTDVEYVFVTFNFLIGVLIFATIVGNVGSMITNMNQSRAEFNAKMDSVKQYMEFRHISKTLENRVIKWFDYLWQNKQSLDEESVLNVLPDKLKTEIAVHVHLGTLEKVKLFQGVDSRLLEQLVLKLKLQVFSPGDYVCRKGDVGKEMYIVKKGKLSVVSEDGQTVFANLTDGAVFGELSVLNIQGNKTGNRRSANVRSVGYSDLFCLNKLDLMQVLEEYPEAKEMLIERGKEILRKDGLLDEDKLKAEEQLKENLMERLQQITVKYDQMTNKFARFIAEYSVSQRKMKQRIYELEKNFENNQLNLKSINPISIDFSNELANQSINESIDE